MHRAARAECVHDATRTRGKLGVREDQVVGDGVGVEHVEGHGDDLALELRHARAHVALERVHVRKELERAPEKFVVRVVAAVHRAGALAAICPETQSEYADLVADDDDLQFAADFLAPFTTRTALSEIQFGSYFVLFAELKGPSVERYIRNYAVKSVNGSMCMTMDLRGDPTYNTTVDLVTASLGG